MQPSHGPLSDAEFAALLDPLGPFEPRPCLAVAVSGGADSLALCLLARRWAAARDGQVLALTCDHGLRHGSGDEASLVAVGLRRSGVTVKILTLAVPPGPGVARRARAARYAALERACAGRGVLHLLVGHHAADQAETVAMRLLAGSGPAGLSGMAAVTEGRHVRLLRPLLPVPPQRLRDTLAAAGSTWLEDPSNADARQLRPRLRALRRDRSGAGPMVAAALDAATRRGRHRHDRDWEVARSLAASVCLDPLGYALVRCDRLDPASIAAVVQAVSGASRPPPLARAASWLAKPRAATLGGTQIRPAGGRQEGDWLFAREPAAVAPPVALMAQTWWDGRFRLRGGVAGTCGALGEQAREVRHPADIPLIVLRTLPAVRVAGSIVAVPQLGLGDPEIRSVFSPAASLSQVFWRSERNRPAAGMHKASRPPILTPA